MIFEDLLTNDDLLDAIYDMHYENCTPIQEKSIPKILEGKDLLAIAQTGTGKTAAYLLPIIERLINDNYPTDKVNCVIMAPTRELAQQIDQQVQGFSYYLPITSMAIYGGTDGETYTQQRKGLKMGADIIIATPGRLLSHLTMGNVNLSEVAFFVLDEADRMLDMGFFDDIMKIVSKLPEKRQTLMFSATMPSKIKQLANKILNQPSEIKIAMSKPADKIKQSAYVCYENQKIQILKSVLSSVRGSKTIIFAGSKIKVKDLTRNLSQQGWKVAEMHSDLDQRARENIMLDFKSGKTKILVATDIVSRGIDIDDIDIIINYDVPGEEEDYVHRVGRTARAEKEGRAFTLISEKDIIRFKRIERLIGYTIVKEIIPEELGPTPEYELKKIEKKRKFHRKKGFKRNKEQ